eukprot:IDg7950t1
MGWLIESSRSGAAWDCSFERSIEQELHSREQRRMSAIMVDDKKSAAAYSIAVIFLSERSLGYNATRREPSIVLTWGRGSASNGRLGLSGQ